MGNQGKYIVFEGPDGVGKTTQADQLADHLNSQGIPTIQLKEPGGLPIGEAIRQILLDKKLDREPITNLLLFTANRHELWTKKIKPALASGTTVIATRNYWSTIAYQGYGEGMDVSLIRAVTAMYTDEDYARPDIGIILDFKDEAERLRRLKERGRLDMFESKPASFQKKIRAGYAEVANHHDIDIIDASGSIQTVHKRITTVIASHFN